MAPSCPKQQDSPSPVKRTNHKVNSTHGGDTGSKSTVSGNVVATASFYSGGGGGVLVQRAPLSRGLNKPL